MTLLAPLFLLGVLAVGLPMWLHRLSSENPNKQKFSSVMFLEPGEPRRVLAKRLQYLLLLAFRIGVLVLLAFAFARPALLGAPEAIVEDSARLNLIIMDTSASMRHGQRWPRARDIAEGIIDDVPSGDLMQLLAVGRTARVLVDPTLEASGLRQSLNALNPDYSHLDYGELMNAVDLTARGVELPVVVHLVTDLQQSSMPTRFAELAAQVPLELNIYDAARPGESNWGVQSVSWTPATQQIAVSVRGYGTPQRGARRAAAAEHRRRRDGHGGVRWPRPRRGRQPRAHVSRPRGRARRRRPAFRRRQAAGAADSAALDPRPHRSRRLVSYGRDGDDDGAGDHGREEHSGGLERPRSARLCLHRRRRRRDTLRRGCRAAA
jgi:hypothetical protein